MPKPKPTKRKETKEIQLPPDPPGHQYIHVLFFGKIETKESRLRNIKYRAFMDGWMFAMESVKSFNK